MNILLGDLKLKDIVVAEYLEKIQSFLDMNGYQHESVCDDVSKTKGNYHIYDIPRSLHIAGEDKAWQFINYLKEEKLVQDAFIGRIGISIE